jgi:hypothetical protein
MSDHVQSCFIKCQLKLPSLIKGRPPTPTPNNNNNKAKCIPGGTLRVLAGKNLSGNFAHKFQFLENDIIMILKVAQA